MNSANELVEFPGIKRHGFLLGLLRGKDQPHGTHAFKRHEHECMRETVLRRPIRVIVCELLVALQYRRQPVEADPITELAHATLVRLLDVAGGFTVQTPERRPHFGQAICLPSAAMLSAQGRPSCFAEPNIVPSTPGLPHRLVQRKPEPRREEL